jgi:hypothetical protein
MRYFWVRSGAAKYRANQQDIDLALVSGTRGRRLESAQACQIPFVFKEKIHWTHFAASGFGTFRNNKPSRFSIARRCDSGMTWV